MERLGLERLGRELVHDLPINFIAQSLFGEVRFDYVWKLLGTGGWCRWPRSIAPIGAVPLRGVSKMRKLQVAILTWAAWLWMGLLLAPAALAFNNVGHMAVAKIAFDRLAPAQREALHAILKQHPHYQEFLAADRPQDVSEQEWSFLRAAAWADWVRNHHEADYHRGPWHYIDFPYTARQADVTTLPAPLPQEKNILTALPISLEIAKHPATPDADQPPGITPEQNRAVRLCWLMHLVGDLHQPCHVTALIDATRFHEPPHDDRGGNLEAILTQGMRPIKLHSYWDTRLGGDDDYRPIAKTVAAMFANPPLLAIDLATEVGETDVNRWALKQYQLAAKYVYLNGNLPIALWQDAYNQPGATAEADVPRLTAEDQADARRITRERVWVAGHRLARLLGEVTP